MDSRDRLFLYTLLTRDTKPLRKYTVFQMAFVGIVLVVLALAFIGFYPHRGSTNKWPSAYGVLGTESKQFWDLSETEFVDLVNEHLPAVFPPLDYLREPKWYDTQRMLTNNSSSWIILFDTVPNNAADDYFWKKVSGIEGHLGDIREVKLSLYGPWDPSTHGQYVRCLVGIFNPGAEDYVVDKLRLSGGATNASNVKVGDVLYTYAGGTSPELIIKPNRPE